jgi:hypothetical protein
MAARKTSPARPSGDALARADRLHLRYRAFGFAIASVLTALLVRTAPPSAWTGLLVTALATWGGLTWWGSLLEARGVPSAFGRPSWSPRLLGAADWLMAVLLVCLIVSLKWQTFVSPALDALSGAGGPLFDSPR